MDDGSDDFEYKTLEEYDSRIHVTRLAGEGVSRARNAGMKLARGEFIAFLDADDVWFPGKLAAQINYFHAHPNVGVVFGEFIKWLPDHENGEFPPAESLMKDCSTLDEGNSARSGWLYTRLLCGLLVGMNTAIIRHKIYARLGGFDESRRIGEDYDYLRHCCVHQVRVGA
jgi:glycosyltransferase involved in cell wall biosynthesis